MRGKLLTAAEERALRANGRAPRPDAKPVVKFFTPDAGATWLISELGEDGDTAFGLCDLGLGSPELGYVSLSDLRRLRGRLGLPVERDRYFRASKSLVAYADEAREAGHVSA